jgi:hypothetical protein
MPSPPPTSQHFLPTRTPLSPIKTPVSPLPTPRPFKPVATLTMPQSPLATPTPYAEVHPTPHWEAGMPGPALLPQSGADVINFVIFGAFSVLLATLGILHAWLNRKDDDEWMTNYPPE